MNLYQNPHDDEQTINLKRFREIMEEYKWITFYLPSHEKAPWHVQFKLQTEIGYPVVVNFWPHKAKAQREHCASVEGWDAVTQVIEDAIKDTHDMEPFDLIEG